MVTTRHPAISAVPAIFTFSAVAFLLMMRISKTVRIFSRVFHSFAFAFASYVMYSGKRSPPILALSTVRCVLGYMTFEIVVMRLAMEREPGAALSEEKWQNRRISSFLFYQFPQISLLFLQYRF